MVPVLAVALAAACSDGPGSGDSRLGGVESEVLDRCVRVVRLARWELPSTEVVLRVSEELFEHCTAPNPLDGELAMRCSARGVETLERLVDRMPALVDAHVIRHRCEGADPQELPMARNVSEEEMRACVSDWDCVPAPVDRCGCWHFSRATSINFRFAEVWRDRLPGTGGCYTAVSSHVSCYSQPVCIRGKCELRGSRAHCAPILESLCEAPVQAPPDIWAEGCQDALRYCDPN